MDLSSLDTSRLADQGVKLHVKHPVTGKPLYLDDKKKERPVTVTVLGADGERFNANRRDLIDKRMAKAQDQRQVSLEEAEAVLVEHLVSVTTGFENIVFDGKPLDFNVANVRLLYTKLKWLREQVEIFVNNRANFLPA